LGHDITGYKDNKEIAYLRYKGTDKEVKKVYFCLNAEKYNNELSGCGDTVKYTNQEIKEALKKAIVLRDMRIMEFFIRLENVKEDVKINWG